MSEHATVARPGNELGMLFEHLREILRVEVADPSSSEIIVAGRTVSIAEGTTAAARSIESAIDEKLAAFEAQMRLIIPSIAGPVLPPAEELDTTEEINKRIALFVGEVFRLRERYGLHTSIIAVSTANDPKFLGNVVTHASYDGDVTIAASLCELVGHWLLIQVRAAIAAENRVVLKN
ncbi:MAG: hypothetical protein ACHREM_08820 [Polyangiales bacterium]